MSADVQQPGNSPLPKQDLFMSPSIPPEIQSEKPKSKKKLLLIVGGITTLLLIGAVGFAVVFKDSPTQTQTQQVVRVEVSNPDPTAKQFIGEITANDSTGAYSMFSEAKRKEINQQAFNQLFIDNIDKTIKPDQCKQYKQSETVNLNTKQFLKITLTCPLKNFDGETDVVFYLSTSQPVVIEGITIEEQQQ